MSTQIIDTLVSAGFTIGEAKTYVALLSLGTSTVGPIVDNSGVSASKVYSILERLMAKGLATVVVDDGTKKFTATEPETLLTYLDFEINKISERKQKVKDLIPELQLRLKSVENKPIAELAIGTKGFETIYTEFIESGKAGQNYLGLGGKVLSFKLQNFWYPYSLKMAENKIVQRMIYEEYTWKNKDQKIARRSERPNYFPLVLPEKYKELPNLLVLGDKSVISGIDEDEKIFSLIIRNKQLTNSFRKLLEMISDLASVPPNYKKYEKEKTYFN